TVKQVEIFGKISENYHLDVPEDLQLSDLNTIEKLAGYIAAKVGGSTAGAPAAVPAAPLTAPSGGADTSEMTAAIKEIIAEQTGYEPEMLETDLDLEADLGIDTVKQVEIFGKISENYHLDVPEDLQLSDLNTIQKLAGYIAGMVSGAQVAGTATASADEAPMQAAETATADGGIKRFSITMEEKPISYSEKRTLSGKKCLVVTDENGYAAPFIAAIKAAGADVVTLGESGTDIECDFSTYENTVSAVNELAKKEASLDCIFNLATVDAFYARKSSDKIINKTIKVQFALVRRYFDSLNADGSIIAAVSFNSVVFAYGSGGEKIVPECAGVSGLYKTLNKECPKALVKVLDFRSASPKKSMNDIIGTFIREITSADAEVEIGYDGETRYGLRLADREPDAGEPIVREGDRLVVTGGARGITYNILLSLVDHFKCDLVIIGRSDIDTLDEKYRGRALTEKDLIADLKETMTGAKPVEVKKAAGRILSLSETVSNIETLRGRGIAVDYHAADVTDAKRIKEIINGYDHIEGVLHAAGLEISQFVGKMEDTAFNSVFDTKVAGLRNIIDALNGREYRYLMTFSSVTARFGNEGQINYTSANDMIGKMLQREAQLNPGRRYKVYDWTAWEGAGMATKETVKKVLESRGLEFLPLAYGVQCFIDDLYDSNRIEVLISGMDHAFDPDNILPQPGSDRVDNFLDTVVEKTGGSAHFKRTLTAERDLFIFDHVFEGTPLFLGATASSSSRDVRRNWIFSQKCTATPYAQGSRRSSPIPRASSWANRSFTTTHRTILATRQARRRLPSRNSYR
ncbi:MAG: KR domain-containing protein, partial [Spirochaetota bacterium]